MAIMVGKGPIIGGISYIASYSYFRMHGHLINLAVKELFYGADVN